MHTYRFNPVFRQWALLGTPVSHELTLEPAHLLHSGSRGDFLAAVNPKQPFVMDPPSQHGTAHALYHEHPPVGEYELLLYGGRKTLADWGQEEWEQWLELLQKRTLHLHHNPHLHHVEFAFHTAWQATVGTEYQRVGDLVATSHAVAGSAPHLEHELVAKVRHAERGYILHDGDDGMIYAPSAPLHEKEVWYIPAHQESAFDRVDTVTRAHAAQALALLFKALLSEWPQNQFVLELHTSFADRRDDATWWIHIYQEVRQTPATLNVLPLPEKFVRDLAYLLGPGQPN